VFVLFFFFQSILVRIFELMCICITHKGLGIITVTINHFANDSRWCGWNKVIINLLFLSVLSLSMNICLINVTLHGPETIVGHFTFFFPSAVSIQ
jgi:hypothetical protein